MKWQLLIVVCGWLVSPLAWAGGTLTANFGNVQVGSQAFLNYSVTNTGSTPMKMTNFQISGLGYQADEDGCESVPANGQCTVEISFWPTLQGFQTGELILQFDTDELDFDLLGWGIGH